MDIRPLTPDLVGDYLRLFDTAFADNPRWAGCYCAYYEDPCSGEDWHPGEPEAAARNRTRRSESIARGDRLGLLAYQDGVPVGWVNARLRDDYGNLRSFAAAREPGDPVVGSVMCFVVHPDHRGQGVATALLAAAEADLREQGAAVIEGYPRTTMPDIPGFPWTAAFYKGSPAMFEAAGFVPQRELDGFTVMRKTL